MGPAVKSSSWTVVLRVAIVVMIGGPAFAFLVVITWGAILQPLAGLILLAPFVGVNYLLWGRLLAPEKPSAGGEREDDEST
jgi:hypothetical protein